MLMWLRSTCKFCEPWQPGPYKLIQFFRYVRIFRGTELMHKRSFAAVGSWVGIILTLWIIGWILAESITVFNNLLGLIAALFASWYVMKKAMPGLAHVLIILGLRTA